jgi:hypothetical protein
MRKQLFIILLLASYTNRSHYRVTLLSHNKNPSSAKPIATSRFPANQSHYRVTLLSHGKNPSIAKPIATSRFSANQSHYYYSLLMQTTLITM